MPTIQPSERARSWGFGLKFVLVFHVCLAILEFSALSIIDGFFDLIGAVIGYCAIRDRNRYNLYQLLCYCIYTGMDFFWGLIRIIMLGTKTTKVPAGSSQWQFRVYVVAVIFGTILYAIACAVSYVLYKELRRILLEHSIGPAMGGPGYGGMQGEQQVGAGAGPNGAYQQVGGDLSPSSQSTRSTAFTGPAYKLGGKEQDSEPEAINI